MTDCIVQTPENVTLIGAGQTNKGILADALRIAPYLVAADRGAEMAQKYGETPKIIMGDMDSVDSATLAQFPAEQVHRIEEQDTTDFDKCLRHICAPLILGVGFMGRRVDHQLAAFHSLLRYPKTPCILIGPKDLVFHLPPVLKIELPPNTRVSLFPLRPVSGTSEGLQWPIDGLQFAAGDRIGTSNISTGSAVSLQMNGTGMLAIIPRATLAATTRALSGQSVVRA